MNLQKFIATILLVNLLSIAVAAQSQTQARINLDYGDRYWVNQRYNEALPYYNEARRLALAAPQDLQVLISLSYRYLALRDERAAWDCYDQATNIAYVNVGQYPDWSKGWLREAVNFYTQHLDMLMRQAGTSQQTYTSFYKRAVWIQNFLAGNTTPTPSNQTTLWLSATVLAPGGKLIVGFNAPTRAGKTTDWIGVYKAGESDKFRHLNLWKYTGGQTSGSLEFNVPNEPGRYELRYLLDNGYTDVARGYVFEVRAAATMGNLPSAAQ